MKFIIGFGGDYLVNDDDWNLWLNSLSKSDRLSLSQSDRTPPFSESLGFKQHGWSFSYQLHQAQLQK